MPDKAETPWQTWVRGAFTSLGQTVTDGFRLVTDELAQFRQQADQSGKAIADELVAHRLIESEQYIAIMGAIEGVVTEVRLHEDNAKGRHEILGSLLAQILERLPEVPTPQRTMHGAAVWSYSTDWQPMLSALTMRDLAARRTYYQPSQGIPSHYSQGGLAVDVAAGRSSQVSFKPQPGTVARGSHDATITTLLQSKPAELDWWISLGNESESPDKGLDAADQVADLLHLCDIRDDVAPGVSIVSTHMGYSFDEGRDMEKWLPPELRARLDAVAINHYQTMTSDWKTWTTIMSKTVAKVRGEWGMPLVIWEWGYPEDPANPTRKADIVAEHAAWCETNEVAVSMHYNAVSQAISRDPRYLQTSGPQTLAAFRTLFSQ